MASQDDDYPPEISKTPEQFKFRELTHHDLLKSGAKPAWNPIRSSCLAVANKFGVIFIGVPTGIKVLHCSGVVNANQNEDLNKHELTNIALRRQPTWINLSSDNLTLSVCCCSDDGTQILFFDVRNIFNTAKSIKTPFYQMYLSKSKNDCISSFMWNPCEESAHLLALSLSNGKLYVISAKDNAPKILKNQDMNCCAVCWGVKGEYLLIGKTDGSLCQLSQELFEVEYSVSVSNVIDSPVRTCDLLWMSDLDIATVYTESDDSDSANLFLARLASKSDFSNVAWKNYEDPTGGMSEFRVQFYLELIDKWELFVFVSSNSSSIAIIAKNKTSGVWEIWNLDDSSRAALPISKYTDEDASAIGVCLITGYPDHAKGGDEQSKTHPVLAILTDDCVLCLFEMINSMNEYSSIVQQIKAPDLQGERVQVKGADLKDGGGGLTFPGVQKPKLTAKASVFSGAKPPFPSYSGFSSSVDPKRILDKVAEGPLAPITTKQPPVVTASAPLFSKPSENAHLGGKVLPQPQQKLLGSTAPSAERMLGSTAPFVERKKVQDVRPKLPSEPVKAKLVNSDEVREVRPKLPSEPVKVKPAASSEKKVKSFSSKVKTDAKSTLHEISEFENELQQFQSTIESTQENLDTLCQRPSELQELESLPLFEHEIESTTKDLSSEIEELSTEILSLFSDAKNVGHKLSLSTEGYYREMMYARPLSHLQRQKYTALENLYRYVVTSARETNALLDYKWENEGGVGSGSRKGKKVKEREWETARQALISNMKVFHDLEVKIVRLGQNIDRLRLSSRIAWNETSSSFSPFKQTGKGRDLSTIPMPEKSSLQSKLEPSKVPETKLPASKQYKLGKFLAQRDGKRLLSAEKTRIAVLRACMKSNQAEKSAVVEPPSSTCSSTTTEESVEDDTDTPSSTSSDEPYQEAVSCMIPHGSATLTYGAPKLPSAVKKPPSKPFTLSGNEESKMNLNHPPQVVNIQNVSESAFKRPSLPEFFEPKPDVPAGAVQVVQSVLDIVKAEKNQPVPQEWSFINKEKEQSSTSAEIKKPEVDPPPYTTTNEKVSPFSVMGRATPTQSSLFSIPSAATTSTTQSEDSLQLNMKPHMKLTAASSVTTSSQPQTAIPSFSSKPAFGGLAYQGKPAEQSIFGKFSPSLSAPLLKGDSQAPSPIPGMTFRSLDGKGSVKSKSPAPSPVPANVFPTFDKKGSSATVSPAPSPVLTTKTPLERKGFFGNLSPGPSSMPFSNPTEALNIGYVPLSSPGSGPSPRSGPSPGPESPLTMPAAIPQKPIAIGSTGPLSSEPQKSSDISDIVSTSSEVSSPPPLTGDPPAFANSPASTKEPSTINNAPTPHDPPVTTNPPTPHDPVVAVNPSTPHEPGVGVSPQTPHESTAVTSTPTNDPPTSNTPAASQDQAAVNTDAVSTDLSGPIATNQTTSSNEPPSVISSPPSSTNLLPVTSTPTPPIDTPVVTIPPTPSSTPQMFSNNPIPTQEPSVVTPPAIVNPPNDPPTTHPFKPPEPTTQEQEQTSGSMFAESSATPPQIEQTENTKPSGFEAFGPAPSAGIGGFGALGFGEKKPVTSTPRNPFASSFGDAADNASKPSIFGQSASAFGASSQMTPSFGSVTASGFGSTPQSNIFGARTTQSFSSFGSQANSSVAAQGFGAFNKPSQSAFGGPPKFGGNAAFGSPATFGGASRPFGSGFGSPESTFGMNTPTAENTGFSSFATGNSTGFGSLANQGGFGGMQSNQPSAGFGMKSDQSPSFTGWR